MFVNRFGCITKRFFNIPCPTCGMTRSMLSLIRFDIASYFYFNAFALPVFFSVIVLFFSKHFCKPIIIVALSIIVLNFIYYLYRLTYNIIP
ncbi:MAG: DUF2752 domain-containing protein [Treponema sp.]